MDLCWGDFGWERHLWIGENVILLSYSPYLLELLLD